MAVLLKGHGAACGTPFPWPATFGSHPLFSDMTSVIGL